MQVVLEGRTLPGRRCVSHGNVHVVLQVGHEPVGVVPGDATTARWVTDVTVSVR